MVRAAVVRSSGGPIELLDLELPALGPDDVRVRVAAAGVCHSDLSMVNGTLSPQFPLVLGHEASGVVTELGTAVTHIAIGSHVVLNWAPPCRRCWFCRHGEPWLCRTVEGVVSTPVGRVGSEQAHGCMGVGAFADEVVLPARAAVPISEDVPLDIAALLGCAVLTGIGAVCNTGTVRPGESAAVFGLGGIGLSAVAGAHWAGANPVIAVDVHPEKEVLARQLGATHFLLGDPDVAKGIRRLTDGRGADRVFECVGRPETIRNSWQSTRRGGQCVIVGVGSRSAEITFNALELFHFSRTLTSSVYGASDPDRDVPMLAEQIRTSMLDLQPLITHRIDLDDVGAAFERMEAGEGARSVIVFPT
jgi:S-(hydroxymethyl)glutathione dehydrogenase / alcohol dehydrogenase